MTTASKLFNSRRIRFGVRNNTVDDIQPDSSPADANSYRRNTTVNRRDHHLNNRNNRLDLDACNPPPRRIHRHRLPEHDQVEQSPTGSIINSEDFRSIRRWGATVNDRLPGVVLLARERLVERLRGVHVSENRYPVMHESWQAVIPMASSRNVTLRPGLSQHALSQLSVKVFKNVEEDNESSSASRECSICLEGFEDGDELVHLGCMHRFHCCCLFPWVEVCGACPNCRKDIVVSGNVEE